MADTVYGVNAPETVKLWSKKLARETLKKTYIGKFIGEGPSSLIQEHKNLQKSAGDKLTYTLRMQLNGEGVQGDAILKGNEEMEKAMKQEQKLLKSKAELENRRRLKLIMEQDIAEKAE